MKTKYLNFEIIIIINKNICDIEKNNLNEITYNNLYIKIIYQNINDFIINLDGKIYLLDNTNNNYNLNKQNINILNDFNDIIEIK